MANAGAEKLAEVEESLGLRSAELLAGLANLTARMDQMEKFISDDWGKKVEENFGQAAENFSQLDSRVKKIEDKVNEYGRE